MLGFLGHEQPDKEVEPLLEVLEVGPENFDSLVALGNLMRRKGAVDRAIGIHQNLVAHPQLDSRQQHRAYLELARDFQKAGLLDRAEDILVDLVAVTAELRPMALAFLLDLYDEEREWAKAITVGERWLSTGAATTDFDRRKTARRVAHYFCESAQQAHRTGQLKQARQYVRRAFAFDRDCFRAGMIEAEIRQQQGSPKRAIEVLQRVVTAQPRLLLVALPLLRRLYDQCGELAGLHQFLRGHLDHHRSSAATLSVSRDLERLESPEAATSFLERMLERQPSLRGLSRLIELQCTCGQLNPSPVLTALCEQIDQVLASRAVYCCEHCGFSGRTLHWQCLSCKQWGCVVPVVGVLGE